LNAAHEGGSADAQPVAHWNSLEIGDNSGDCFENTSANNAPSITQIATWNLGVVSGNSKIASTRVN
jgi:hypothetical protein